METLKDDLPNMALELAYFIHQERETAKDVTIAALESLETTTLTQDKRFYYPGRRTKVSFSELHLLQRLVYEKSDIFEQQRENDTARPISEERLLVHFIKHLVWITVRRKSLYVALGLGRLLHRYTTAETMEIYNVIIQDPERVPTEDYFRNRKKLLMDQLHERFSKFVLREQGGHGAARFVSHDQSARFVALVEECLSAFTPWQTDCHVPDHFDPTETALPDLNFNSLDPDEEHRVEIKRYHALLHPECFARLLRALGYAASAQRLEIPRFCLANQAGGAGPNDPTGGAQLNDRERDEMRIYLRDRNRRRKTANTQLLRFVANGVEVAYLDLQQTDRIDFQLPKYSEFLEIRSRDAHDDLLLATHRLSYNDYDQLQAQDAVIVLQNGQELAFEITPAGATADAMIAVTLNETNPMRALRLWLKRHYASANLRSPLWRPALGLLVLTAFIGLVYMLFIKSAAPKSDVSRSTSPIPVRQVSPTPQVMVSPTPQGSPRPNAPLSLPGDDVIAVNMPIGPRTDSLTRSGREAAVVLLGAGQVFLEIKGNEQLRRQVSVELHAQFPRAALFELTENRDSADIALKVEVAPLPVAGAATRISLIARIVDADGKILWPLTPDVAARKYSGLAEKIAIKLSKELSADLKKYRR